MLHFELWASLSQIAFLPALLSMMNLDRIEKKDKGHEVKLTEIEEDEMLFFLHKLDSKWVTNNLIPWMQYDVVGCVAKHAKDPARCSKPRESLLNDAQYIKGKQEAPQNVHFIDLAPHFCDKKNCYAVMGNIAIYRDQHHITVPFAESLTDIINIYLKNNL